MTTDAPSRPAGCTCRPSTINLSGRLVGLLPAVEDSAFHTAGERGYYRNLTCYGCGAVERRWEWSLPFFRREDTVVYQRHDKHETCEWPVSDDDDERFGENAQVSVLRTAALDALRGLALLAVAGGCRRLDRQGGMNCEDGCGCELAKLVALLEAAEPSPRPDPDFVD